MVEEQAETTFEVLKELNAKNTPIITVLNKRDVPGTAQMIQRMRFKYPHTAAISALTQEGFDDLIQKMIEELSKQRKVVNLRIPQSQYKVVSEMIRLGHVLQQDFEENDVLMKVEIPSSAMGKASKIFIIQVAHG